MHDISDEIIVNAYHKHKTLGMIAVELGIPQVSVWRRCKKLGLSFKIGGSNTKFRLEDILDGKHPQYQTNKLKKRLINEGVFENVCLQCGISVWNGQELILHLDHINGMPNDHRLENLRLLCPNCHSQTHTWCGKNKVK